MPARQYFSCPDFLVSLSLSHQTRPGMGQASSQVAEGQAGRFQKPVDTKVETSREWAAS